MITLEQLLEVCTPDWIEMGQDLIEVRRRGIPNELLRIPVKNITGWDDGLTVELDKEGYADGI